MARKTKESMEPLESEGRGRTATVKQSKNWRMVCKDEFAEVLARLGGGEEGGSAPLCEAKPALEQPLEPENTEIVTIPQDIQEIVAKSSEMTPTELREALTPLFQSRLAAGLLNVPAPRSLVEYEKLFKLWWLSSGLGETKGPAGPGLLGPGRGSFGRRATGPTLDAVPVDTPDNGDDGFDWPEGMD